MRTDRRRRRHLLLRLVVCAGVLLASATLTTSAASGSERATGVVLFDGPGDVHDFDYPLDDADPPDLVGRVPTADVLRAYVTHAPYALGIRMRFTDLRRGNRFQQSFGVSIRTPRGSYDVSLLVTPRSPIGRHRIVRHVTPAEVRPVRCSDLTHLIRYRTDIVRFRIPRSCLRQPRFVRVHLTNAMSPDFNDEAGPHYLDTPHSRSIDDATLARPVFTSPLYQH